MKHKIDLKLNIYLKSFTEQAAITKLKVSLPNLHVSSFILFHKIHSAKCRSVLQRLIAP